jgi:ribonucleotide reductase beta subunit family protein with ferritin-like domain
MMENIHSETYSLLIDTYVRTKLKKINYLMRWKFSSYKEKNRLGFTMDRVWFICRALIAFAAVEGIFFSGAFVPFIG